MTAQLRLYNTLTRKKELFTPLDPSRVRMYVCGPTVYDFAHIGNARPVIIFDVLFRLLRHIYGAGNVIYTRNITDVDDKINERAARDYPDLPLNEAIRKVTEGTNAQFQADVAALGCLEPTHQPRATAHIQGMLDVTQRLLDKGFAYVAEGAEGKEVLFAVTAMPRYGQLSNRKLEEQEAGARVAVEAHKRNPGDFVLWKQSSADQPGWEASFRVSGGTVSIFGRPGWHIECSAMSMATLLEPFGGGLACDDPVKNTFDIHGGGIDLVFPHHENEIAQSCCAFGSEKMAQIWMHNGFLQVEGRKMSKSLGNFRTIREVLADWPGEVVRFTMLKTHYRQPIDWTLKSLEESFRVLRRLATHTEAVKKSELHRDFDEQKPLLGNYLLDVLPPLLDDLNTPLAISRLSAAMQGGQSLGPNSLAASLKLLGLEALVGQQWPEPSLQGVDEVQINAFISLRLAARAAKNWAESDRIRDELASMGIQLKDGKDTDGNPITTWEVKR
ncbi:MAG: cysteine--tRNA ligase [Beijerinckiaceae bacterium]|nr:cysteine--tRNA ligase [Beijerinckiaceae bacterium]